MEDRAALPSLISTLAQYERGRGVFDKSLSQELKKSSTQVGRKGAQKSPSKDSEIIPMYELDCSELDGVNSYVEYSELVKSRGLEEYSSASSPGSHDSLKMRNQSNLAAEIAIPDHIRQFREEWESATENRIKLPVIRQLSPRTRKKVSLLPPPNAIDLKKLESFETVAAERVSPHFYKDLKDRAVREEMSRMRQGVFTMQDISAKHAPSPHHATGKYAKYMSDDESDMSVSFDSAAFFNDVRDRQMRQKKAGSRAKLVGGELSDDDNSSKSPQRPASPKLSAYPFQTGLTSFLSRQAQQGSSPGRGGSLSGSEYSPLSRGSAEEYLSPKKCCALRQPSVTGGGTVASSSKQSAETCVRDKRVDLEPRNRKPALLSTQSVRALEAIYKPLDASFLHSLYDPVLQEATTVANEALSTYGRVAQAFDKNQQQSHHRRKNHDTFMSNWKTGLLEDIGLDIDPAHNTRVKYGKAITLVIYHLIIVKFKHAIEIWKHFVFKANKLRRDRAARLLGRVCRGMLARQMAAEMRINRQRQREAEQKFERQRRAFQNFMSRRIALAWRRHRKWQSKKLRRLRYVAARTIQKRARGNSGRAYARWYRMYKERCLASCIIVQSVWRMYKAKRRVTLLRKLEYVRQWELSKAEKLMLQRMEYRHHGASMTLCRAYRAHTIHARLREILYWNRFQLALRIQCVYRGYAVRKLYRRLALAKANKELLRNNAATLIQSLVRRYHAMRAFYVMTEGKRQRDERRRKRKRKKLKDLVCEIVYLAKGSYSSCHLYIYILL